MISDWEDKTINELGKKRGPLSWFASNHVAANLLMLFVMGAGFFSLLNIRVEVFPEVSIDMVTVSVPYLGASPAEVEEGVCMRVEEALVGIDGIKQLRSTAMEGMGMVTAELEDYADITEVRDEIEAEVGRIITFPEETEKPIIREITNRTQVMTIALYGDVSERTLKNLAEQIRDDLMAKPNISQVDISGVRRFEISIEVPEENLRRYGLSFDAVAAAVGQSALDLPGGSVKTAGGEILVRTKGQRYKGSDYEDIAVMARNDGTKLLLGDIATIRDDFEDSDKIARFDGKSAAMINVSRVGEQDALEVAATIKEYVEQKQKELPAGISMATWLDRSRYLQSRLDLLKRNAMWGLALVFICLTLFMDMRLAFWTFLGIPISFLGSFWILHQYDVSINMISLFAFIVALGIVVDDAIVVGENIFDYMQKGMSRLQAAIVGVREMSIPVTVAVLTTAIAFVPIVYTKGIMGKFMKTIPIVVISVFMISLVEALLILPAHLSAGKPRRKLGLFGRLQGKIRDLLDLFVKKVFAWCLERFLAWRYVTLALGLAILIGTIGFVKGGHIKFTFMPKIDSDNIWASLTMPQGTSLAQTEAVVKKLELTAAQLREQIDAGRDDNEKPIFRHMSTNLGEQPFSARVRGGGSSADSAGASHLAEINIELLSSEERSDGYPSPQIANQWRQMVGEIPGVSSLTFTATIFSAGEAINVELTHRDFNKLLEATEELKVILSGYEGLSDIADSFEPGKIELKLKLTEEGRTQGLTLADLASQVRQGFYGHEVQRIQRGRDDIRVMVRYPENERKSLADIENIRIRLRNGVEVPFTKVAQVDSGRGYATINRADRHRVVSVTADVDETIANAQEINQDLMENILPELQIKYPGLNFSFEGQEKERMESINSLKRNFVIALLAMFALLAVQFRSYIQPVIVMSAIPFGLIGAVIGHLIMGFDLSLLSLFGIVALTGVVVNDSLILVDLINRRRSSGEPLALIVRDSAVRRFRPILLTTLTTFFGLSPMILEKSIQAKFLVPMAISLGFGVVFATAITLVLVPNLYMILEDGKNLIRTRFKSIL